MLAGPPRKSSHYEAATVALSCLVLGGLHPACEMVLHAAYAAHGPHCTEHGFSLRRRNAHKCCLSMIQELHTRAIAPRLSKENAHHSQKALLLLLPHVYRRAPSPRAGLCLPGLPLQAAFDHVTVPAAPLGLPSPHAHSALRSLPTFCKAGCLPCNPRPAPVAVFRTARRPRFTSCTRAAGGSSLAAAAAAARREGTTQSSVGTMTPYPRLLRLYSTLTCAQNIQCLDRHDYSNHLNRANFRNA